jgi:hypothetical protein
MSWCSSPQAIDGKIEPLYSEEGRPGWTRFVIGLLLLKHIFALSDEEVCERWVYDPLFPVLCHRTERRLAFSGDPAP